MASKSSGLALIAVGNILIIVGLLFSLTGIGACIGIPMAIVGVPMAIVGGLRYRRASLEQLTNSIRDGITNGMKARAEGTPCPKCGHRLAGDAKFCESCGQAVG